MRQERQERQQERQEREEREEAGAAREAREAERLGKEAEAEHCKALCNIFKIRMFSHVFECCEHV
jgi:sRNA-binding protein